MEVVKKQQLSCDKVELVNSVTMPDPILFSLLDDNLSER